MRVGPDGQGNPCGAESLEELEGGVEVSDAFAQSRRGELDADVGLMRRFGHIVPKRI